MLKNEILSKIFNVVAHPDSIKCFNYYPSIDLKDIYKELSLSLKDNNVKAEFSNGLYINYDHEELGLNRDLLKVFLENGVEIVTSSDAHRPEDVGKFILEANNIIKKFKSHIPSNYFYLPIYFENIELLSPCILVFLLLI